MILEKWINLLVFLFCVTVLSYSGHGGQSAFLLLLTAIYILFNTKERVILDKDGKVFVFIVLAFFTIQLFGAIYQPEGFEFQNIRDNFKALDNPMRWLLLLPVFFIFHKYVIDWRLIAIGIGIGVTISIFIAYNQVNTLMVERAYSIFGNPIPFGQLMLVSDIFLWILMNYAWKRNKKTLALFLLIFSMLAFYGTLLSVTRGVWLVYFCLIAIVIGHNILKGVKNIKYLFSISILFRIVLMAVVYYFVSQTAQFKTIEARAIDFKNNLTTGDIAKISEGRFEVFKTSINIIKEHPFGVGTNNFLIANKKYRDNSITDEFRNQAHNELLNIWVENGIQSVVILFLLFGFAFKVFWKNINHKNKLVGVYSYCGIGLIVSYAIFGQTQATFSHHSTLIFFVFFLYFFFAQVQLLNKKNN
jgi:O-antigen ligase